MTERGTAVHRVSDIIGKPVVSAESGDRLGSVSDALVEPEGVSVVGLVVGGGVLAKEHVLPFGDIQTLGGDTVLARTHAGVVAPREWRRGGVKATRSSKLRGRPVLTAGGEKLGEVSDLLVDEHTGAFDGLEISAHQLAGLRTKRSIVRARDQIRIGRDAVVVPEAALESGDDGADPDAA